MTKVPPQWLSAAPDTGPPPMQMAMSATPMSAPPAGVVAATGEKDEGNEGQAKQGTHETILPRRSYHAHAINLRTGAINLRTPL